MSKIGVAKPLKECQVTESNQSIEQEEMGLD